MGNILGNALHTVGSFGLGMSNPVLGAAASITNDLLPGVNATNVAKTQYDNLTGTYAPGYNAPQTSYGAGILARPASGTQQDVTGTNTGAYTGTSAADRQAAADAAARAQNNAYIDLQLGNLNDLLGRTDTGLTQGLSSLSDSYGQSVAGQNHQHDQALQDYTDQRTATNKDKLGAYDTINKNANNGYRSLAQIIGRSAGTGSSAFQDLLPNVVGKDMSSKRGDANATYASNLGNIDVAQKKTDQSFAQILQDLANQRSAQEQTLRSGVESQRQNILGQQQALQAQRGNLSGANALQGQIDNSRNSVESFFNQFKPTYNAQQAVIAAPDLSQYKIDRSNVNAQANGSPDPSNPYADILRKKLQEQGV